MIREYLMSPLTGLLFLGAVLLFAALFVGPSHAQTFKFGAVGDLDCTKDTQKNVDLFRGKEVGLVLWMGDLKYECSSADFAKMWAPLSGKIKASMGNHDDFNELAGKYGFPKDKEYYSFDTNGVHFISMSTEESRSVGSSQYNFLVNDINQACHDTDKTNWIVIFFHKPSITSPTKHPAEKNQFATLQPIFNGCVDLVLQAHNHNYQRTYPVTNDRAAPIIVDKSNTYLEGNHSTYMTIGGGGHDLYSLKGTDPVVVKQFSEFGAVIFTVDGANSLTGQYYSAGNPNAAKDKFTISKPEAAPQPEPEPEPLPPVINETQPEPLPTPPIFNGSTLDEGKYCNFFVDQGRALLPYNGSWILIKTIPGYALIPMADNAKVPAGTVCLG